MPLFNIKDIRPTPDIIHPYTLDVRENRVPIVIDNGSSQCRVGWATDNHPKLLFKNIVAKQRGKKEMEAQVGNDIGNIEVVRWLLKAQFDRDVVTQYDVQEQIFDYVFAHLGIDTQGCVEHPIVVTETLCNPSYSRQLMSELLFEGYHVPGIAYGIDSLFSFRHNGHFGDGLVVSCGHQVTHVIPMLGGIPRFEHSRRINVGGSQLTSFMHRVLQLKYPGHFSAITLSRAENFVHEHTFVSNEYAHNLAKWCDVDYYEENVHKIQLPFNPLPGVTTSSEAVKERRQQQIKRLQEMNAKRREEKLAADEEKLRQLCIVRELLEDEDEDAFNRALEEFGLTSTNDLHEAIGKLKVVIGRTRKKMSNDSKEVEFQPTDEPKAKRLCDELAAKSHGDLDSWLAFIRQKRQELLDSKAQRRQRRSDMAKRRTLAAQERMKIISELAADRKKEDNFGQNEDDWQVYKTINREAGDSDSEEEQEKIQELEQILQENDPAFAKENAAPDLAFDLAEYYQLHLAVERIRVPELLFQPSMMGIEQAGIGETIGFVLSKFDAETQARLVKNVFLCGGCAKIVGLKERLESCLLEMRPFRSEFVVNVSNDLVLDSWCGAKEWANDKENVEKYFLLKEDYDEMGGDYVKEHPLSNRYVSHS